MNIEVKKTSSLSLNLDMMKSSRFYAKIICATNPQGAKILLNDVPTNLVTPATLTNIYPGIIEVKFLKNQYRDDSLILKIKGGQYTEIYRTLEDTSRTVSYRTNNSNISSNMLRKVVVDNNNNKWIGSMDRGLIKFDGKKWTSYENAGVIVGTNVQDLLVDKKGHLWVGTIRGLTVFDGISWQSYTDKLPSEVVTALEEDVNGNIWIATFGGLVKYDNNSFRVYTSQNTGFPLENLSSLSSSKTGELWVGSNTSGILRFNGSIWNKYIASEMDLETRNVSNIIKDLVVDNNGNVWSYHSSDPSLQVVSGLLRFDGSNWKEVKLPILFHLELNSFYPDNENNVWMSVEGGLLKYSYSKPLKVFDPYSNGFFSNQCTSFIIDQNGDGWLTTLGGGIAKLKKGTF
jgi:ligand-binding sensor domain-containing protein